MEFTSSSRFQEFKLNPSYLLLLIDQYVQYYNISPPEENFQTTLIPGHAVLDVCVKEPDENIKSPIKKPSYLPTACIAQRKQRVLEWLKENMLPVSELDDNIVCGNVTILPPYNVTDVCTDNPMVAQQLMNIMNKMPDNNTP